MNKTGFPCRRGPLTPPPKPPPPAAQKVQDSRGSESPFGNHSSFSYILAASSFCSSFLIAYFLSFISKNVECMFCFTNKGLNF